jgi:hypothetical protein
MKKLPFILLLFLWGCTAPDLEAFKVEDFKSADKIYLNAAEVSVDSEVTQFDRLPHIESRLPVSPEQALTAWAENRFDAVRMSSPDDAVILIKDAYMTQTKKPSGHWYLADNIEYELTYRVQIQFNRDGKKLYEYTAKGYEMKSLPQKSSLAAKEKAYKDMMNAMVKKVDDNISANIPPRFKDE